MSNIESEVKQTTEIVFCDYIQVTDSVDDEYIFNVVCISNQGLGLKNEDGPFIKDLTVTDSKLIAYYPDGKGQILLQNIKSIAIDDLRMKRRSNGIGIEGTLLNYSFNMAEKYDLEVEKSYDYINHRVKRRTR